MADRSVPSTTSPQQAYEFASRSMARECRNLGAGAAVEAFHPRRLVGGWWSPLFTDVVLRARTPRRPEVALA